MYVVGPLIGGCADRVLFPTDPSFPPPLQTHHPSSCTFLTCLVIPISPTRSLTKSHNRYRKLNPGLTSHHSRLSTQSLFAPQPAPAIRAECEEKECAEPAKHFKHCAEKVEAGKGWHGEDCVEELFHMMHCVDVSVRSFLVSCRYGGSHVGQPLWVAGSGTCFGRKWCARTCGGLFKYGIEGKS